MLDEGDSTSTDLGTSFSYDKIKRTLTYNVPDRALGYPLYCRIWISDLEQIIFYILDSILHCHLNVNYILVSSEHRRINCKRSNLLDIYLDNFVDWTRKLEIRTRL